MTETTNPQTDRPRALAFLEAADLLRDAHFRDGLTVQEIGTALRHMADDADPMVGSLARDGFGLDEIAAMCAAPAAVPSAPADRSELRDRIAAAMREHWLCTIRDEADADGNLPCRCGDWREPGAEVDDENDWDSHLADVALAVVPSASADRAAILLRDAASYLTALHGSVARHDNLAANLGCAGCELRDQIRAELAAPVLPEPADRAAGPAALREAAAFYETVLQQSLSPDSDPRYCTAVRDIVMGLRRRADDAQRCLHGCDVSRCPCLACEAEQRADEEPTS
jgi:hypothetical protein